MGVMKNSKGRTATEEFTDATARAAMAALYVVELVNGDIGGVTDTAWANVETAVEKLQAVLAKRSKTPKAKHINPNNAAWREHPALIPKQRSV